MSDDLITSLRALAAGRHDDVSVAVDAVIEIEGLRAEMERMQAEMPVAKSLETAVTCLTIERDEARNVVSGLVSEMADLRAEVERLRLADDLTRTALGGWVFVPPDGGAEPTHERVAAVVAEVDRQREENEQLRGALGLRDALRHAAGQEEIERLRSDFNTAIRERDEARADNERLREEMREIAEDCESECPQIYEIIARYIREALEAKP